MQIHVTDVRTSPASDLGIWRQTNFWVSDPDGYLFFPVAGAPSESHQGAILCEGRVVGFCTT
jgi:hypothetical protein